MNRITHSTEASLNCQRFMLSIGVLALAAFLRLWQIAQLPPGLHHDEAFHLLRAQEIMRGEALPVYNTSNNGNEVLITYLAAFTLSILGPVTWAGRLAAAWAGLLSVALTLRAGNELFPKQRSIGPWAGLALATLYWNIDFSRFGTEPILAAMAAAGAVAALWCGARTGRRRAYLLAGVSLGLGLVGYAAFRLFPLALGGAGLALFITQRPNRKTLLVGGLLAAGVAILIYTPEGLFFIRNPQWFLNRFGQVTQGTLGSTDPGRNLLTNALKTLGGLFVSGDGNWRHNLALRPALDAAQALFVLLGMAVCLARWRTPESWALGLWLAVGLAPSVVTVEAPHFGRTVMATPALALLMGVGIASAWQWTSSRLAHGLIVTALGLSITLTATDYFGRWAHDPHLFSAFSGEQVSIAHALESVPAGSSFYLTPLGFRQDYWTVEYLLGTEAFKRFRAFDGQACLVMPSSTTKATTYAVVVADDQQTLPELASAFPAGTQSIPNIPEDPSYLHLYNVPAGQQARLNMGVARRADFGGFVRMVGYTLAADAPQPGGQLQLQIAWQAEQPTPTTYKIFVHLIGPPTADGNVIYTQRDTPPCADSYPSWQWRPGELIIDTYTLILPNDLPPGQYTLQTGWYEDVQGRAGARLPITDDAGQSLGDALKLEPVQIGQP